MRAAAPYWLLMLALGCLSPALGDDADAMSSVFLVARKDLPDPFFRDSVVLVTSRRGPAPVGVIINRPTDVKLSSLFSDIERLRGRDDKVFFGGPVRRGELAFVFRASKAPDDAIEILEGVYLSSNRELLRELLGRETAVEGLRVFAGHAGWGPGQLESEVTRGDWHLSRADAKTIFESKPEGLWRELERRASSVVAGIIIESP